MSASIQTAIYGGIAALADVLGQPVQQYRALSANNPTGLPCLLQVLNAYFNDKPDFSGTSVPLIGKAAWFVAIDGTQTAPGDYLLGMGSSPGDNGTWFISDQAPFMSIGVVKCNGTLSVYRPSGNPGFGAQPYGGDAVSAELPIMLNWPGSLLQGLKGEKGDTQLPGDIRMPWFNMQIPAFRGVEVKAGDILVDDLDRRFKVSSCELTTRGWRLTAQLAQT